MLCIGVLLHIILRLSKLNNGAFGQVWGSRCPVSAHSDSGPCLPSGQLQRPCVLCRCCNYCRIYTVHALKGRQSSKLYNQPSSAALPARCAPSLPRCHASAAHRALRGGPPAARVRGGQLTAPPRPQSAQRSASIASATPAASRLSPRSMRSGAPGNVCARVKARPPAASSDSVRQKSKMASRGAARGKRRWLRRPSGRRTAACGGGEGAPGGGAETCKSMLRRQRQRQR